MPYQTDNDSICNSIYVYDFLNNQWSNVIGNMKVPRYAFQALVNDNKIYLIGGLGGAYYTNESEALENVEIFNTLTSQCSFGPPMNSKRSCFAAVSLNDSIFVIGGIDEKNNLINDILQFHPADGMWTKKTIFPPPHPQGRHSMGAGILNGNIVIVGGGADLSIDKANFADGVVRKYYP